MHDVINVLMNPVTAQHNICCGNSIYTGNGRLLRTDAIGLDAAKQWPYRDKNLLQATTAEITAARSGLNHCEWIDWPSLGRRDD